MVSPKKPRVGMTPEEEQAAKAFFARGSRPVRTSIPAPAPPRPQLRWFVPSGGAPEAQLQCLVTDATGVQYWARVPVEREAAPGR